MGISQTRNTMVLNDDRLLHSKGQGNLLGINNSLIIVLYDVHLVTRRSDNNHFLKLQQVFQRLFQEVPEEHAVVLPALVLVNVVHL